MQITMRRSWWITLRVAVLLAVIWGLGSWSSLASARQRFDLSKVLTMSDRAKAKLPDQIKRQAIHTYGLKSVALSNTFLRKHNTRYRYQIPRHPTHQVRDQQYSGNCWIFASGRVLASKLHKKNREAPKLSASFVNYHMLRQVSFGILADTANAKSRRPNMSAIEHADEGGYQIWAMNIIKNHGFVPDEKMPMTADAADSGVYINRLQALLASAQVEFSRIAPGTEAKAQRKATLKKYKGMVEDLLQTALGKPPKRFSYKGQRYTPRTFSTKFLGLQDKDLDYVTLTHYTNRAWNRGYCTTDTPGMKPFTEYNVSKSVIQQAVKKTLRDGEAVLFGINVGDDHPHRASGKNLPDKAKGLLSKAAFKYDNLIPSPRLSKRDKLKAGLSGADHAMAITGYNPGGNRGSVQKWKVENSHGTDAGDKGYFHMYNDYFQRHVEDVVVPRSSVPASVLKQLESRSVLKPTSRKTSP